MKILFALSAFCVLSVCAGLGPHAVERLRISDDSKSVVYKDRMSDGTFRDSQMVKPKPPEYPERIELVGTNDMQGIWCLVYAAHYEDGRVETNVSYVVKTDPRDRLKTVPTMPPAPGEPDKPPAKTDALELAKARILPPAAAATNSVVKMAPHAPRVLSSKIKGNKVVHTLDDGTTIEAALKRAHTARVTTEATKTKGTK